MMNTQEKLQQGKALAVVGRLRRPAFGPCFFKKVRTIGFDINEEKSRYRQGIDSTGEVGVRLTTNDAGIYL